MNALFIMIPVTLLLSLGSLAAFFWATRSGQWDDLDLTPRKLLSEQKPTEDVHAEK